MHPAVRLREYVHGRELARTPYAGHYSALQDRLRTLGFYELRWRPHDGAFVVVQRPPHTVPVVAVVCRDERDGKCMEPGEWIVRYLQRQIGRTAQSLGEFLRDQYEINRRGERARESVLQARSHDAFGYNANKFNRANDGLDHTKAGIFKVK